MNIDYLLIECKLLSTGATVHLTRKQAAGLVAAGRVELVIRERTMRRQSWSNTRDIAPTMVRSLCTAPS